MSAITCLRHDCDRKVVQLFRTTPTKCSACNKDILEGDSEYLTVVPCPFKQANQVICDVVIALSADQSGPGFDGAPGLHIGVCDSNGRVLEFDRTGILYGEPSRADGIWKKCTNLDIMKRIGIDVADWGQLAKSLWDQSMDQFLSEFLDRLKRDSGEHLSSQQVDELLSRCSNKVEFCQHFVLSKTKELARYIALDRSLQLSANLVSR